MKAGYARVSTKEQTVDLQVDALEKAGRTTVNTEIMSGTRAERPIFGKLLQNLRTGDSCRLEARSPWPLAQTPDRGGQRIHDAQDRFKEP